MPNNWQFRIKYTDSQSVIMSGLCY
jgi:hypothetical protein